MGDFLSSLLSYGNSSPAQSTGTGVVGNTNNNSPSADNGDYSNFWNNVTTDGQYQGNDSRFAPTGSGGGFGSLVDYGQLASGIASIGGNILKGYGALQSADIARDNLDFTKDAFYKNYNSQKELLAARDIKQTFARDNSSRAGANSILNSRLDANKQAFASRT